MRHELELVAPSAPLLQELEGPGEIAQLEEQHQPPADGERNVHIAGRDITIESVAVREAVTP